MELALAFMLLVWGICVYFIKKIDIADNWMIIKGSLMAGLVVIIGVLSFFLPTEYVPILLLILLVINLLVIRIQHRNR